MLAQVLIVDDEPSIRSSLGGILSDEGYEVSQAPDGESALALLEQEVPDIMLLDVWLPGIDGLQVLERVKKRLPELPVVMISGHGTVETAVKATRLGAYDFIEKPLDMDKILLAVRNGLAMSRLTEENLLLRAKAEAPSITGSSKAIQAVRSGHRPSGPHRLLGAHHRGKRHRQGAGGPRHPPPKQAGGPHLRGRQLRGHPRGAHRERAVRPRKGGLHRGHRQKAGQVRPGPPGHPVPGRDRGHEP